VPFLPARVGGKQRKNLAAQGILLPKPNPYYPRKIVSKKRNNRYSDCSLTEEYLGSVDAQSKTLDPNARIFFDPYDLQYLF